MTFRVKNSLAKLKKSWTVWLNLGSALLAGAELQFHLLQPYLGDKWYGLAYFSLIMLNLALRFKTEMKHQKVLATKDMK